MKLLPGLAMVAAVTLFSVAIANAQDAVDTTARWKAPTVRENGDALSPDEIASYKLYMIKDSELSLDATIASGTSHSFRVLAGKCYDIYVTAVDTNNLESKPGNTITVCAMAPGAPTDFKVTMP